MEYCLKLGSLEAEHKTGIGYTGFIEGVLSSEWCKAVRKAEGREGIKLNCGCMSHPSPMGSPGV